MKPFSVSVLVLVLSIGAAAQAPPSRPAADADEASATSKVVFPASLAGRWRSRPYELPLTSDLHREVYGPNARSVRLVEMTIRPTGDGVLTVTSSVRNAAGRVVAGTRQIEEVRFTVGGVEESSAGVTPRYSTRVSHADRRYPDEGGAPPFELDGAKVFVSAPGTPADSVEVRFEPPEGTGSFWETLRRVSRAATP
jgi:hypothetical protein